MVRPLGAGGSRAGYAWGLGGYGLVDEGEGGGRGGIRGGERVGGRQEGGREFGAGVEQDGVCLRR